MPFFVMCTAPIFDEHKLCSQQKLQTVSDLSLKLQTYCQELHINKPDYTVFSTQSGDGFYCTISIAGKSYTGAIRLGEKEAKECATQEAVAQLFNLREFNFITVFMFNLCFIMYYLIFIYGMHTVNENTSCILKVRTSCT